MLFNSVEFIFAFLPVTLGAFWAVLRVGNRAAARGCWPASLFFYGWWSPRHVVLLLLSIAFNYAVGMALCRAADRRGPASVAGGRRRGRPPPAGLLQVRRLPASLAQLAARHRPRRRWASCCRSASRSTPSPRSPSWSTPRAARRRSTTPVHYALFVTYFPHLIAGPILHHKEMMPQFKALRPDRLRRRRPRRRA